MSTKNGVDAPTNVPTIARPRPESARPVMSTQPDPIAEVAAALGAMSTAELEDINRRSPYGRALGGEVQPEPLAVMVLDGCPLTPAADLDPIEAQHWRDLRDARAHLVAANHLVESARLHRNDINDAAEKDQDQKTWWSDRLIREHLVEAIAAFPDLPESSAGIMPPSTVAEPEGAEGVGS